MRYVELIRQRMLLAAASSGLLAGAVIGAFLPIRTAPPIEGQALQWNLPPVQSIRRFDSTQYESLKTARFWNTHATARGPGAGGGAKSWTLNAIMTRPFAKVAVVTPGTSAQTWIPMGGVLPDGAVIVAINRDAIWVEQNGCRRMRRLYAAADAASKAKTGDEDTCVDNTSAPGLLPSALPASKPMPETPVATPSNGK